MQFYSEGRRSKPVFRAGDPFATGCGDPVRVAKHNLARIQRHGRMNQDDAVRFEDVRFVGSDVEVLRDGEFNNVICAVPCVGT